MKKIKNIFMFLKRISVIEPINFSFAIDNTWYIYFGIFHIVSREPGYLFDLFKIEVFKNFIQIGIIGFYFTYSNAEEVE